MSVLPVDEAGRVLLARHAGHDDGWGVLGGAVDVGESPAAAAVSEAREEISADVQLVRLAGVLGGPDFEVTYPPAAQTDLSTVRSQRTRAGRYSTRRGCARFRRAAPPYVLHRR